MNTHLTENQITEWVLGTNDEATLRHLETCPACLSEAEGLRNTLSGFRDAMHAAAQRNLSLRRNRELAFDGAGARDWYPLHWAWIAAMVVVLIMAIFLTRTPSPPRNYSTDDADNALLQAVQGDLGREVPQALAPAVLIAQERNEILGKRRQMK